MAKKKQAIAPSMEKGLASVEQDIIRGGKILRTICRIAEIVLSIALVVNMVLMVVELFNKEAMRATLEAYGDNRLIQLLTQFIDMRGLDEVYLALIGCAVVTVSNAILLFFVHRAYHMFGYLAEGNRPFDQIGALKIRKSSWLLLLLGLYNLPLGLIAFAITMLFSYIFEYGAYIQQQADETNRIQEEMIVSFAEITENKSGQTGQHIKRVSEYTRILAKQLGYPPETVEEMRIASTMHDIGKLMIPSEILDKPGRLTDQEYDIIKTHTTYGGELLKNVEGNEMVLSKTIALQHHERVDGKGYPAHLTGEEISMAGRIVAVADVYDALTSRRSYKDAWKEEDAAAEIIRCSGTQFDPQVVKAFQQAHDQIVEVQQQYRDAIPAEEAKA